ncbi:MAG: hypothetical protein H0T51_24065, partial [Pirellulales bacterium]|nr:hypothetical protein [Pirellulales bacterium]
GVARFEKLLRQHAIQLGPEPAAVDAMVKAKQLDEEIADRLGGETFSRAIEPAPAEADRGAKAGADSADDGVDVTLLVEASPEQIDALLRSCQSDKESFAEVSVPESMARNEATKLKMDRNAGRAQRFAAAGPLAEEKEAATAEKKLAKDALPQVAGEPAQAAIAGGAGGGGRQRGIGGARAWLLLPPEGGGGAMYWEEESPPTAAPPAGQVRVLFRLRPLPLPAAPPAAQPAEAKP